MDTIRARVRPIELTPLPRSSAIKAVGYDFDRGILRVQFRKPEGSLPYDFPGESSERYFGLLKAKSAGAYFARHIDRRQGKVAA